MSVVPKSKSKSAPQEALFPEDRYSPPDMRVYKAVNGPGLAKLIAAPSLEAAMKLYGIVSGGLPAVCIEEIGHLAAIGTEKAPHEKIFFVGTGK